MRRLVADVEQGDTCEEKPQNDRPGCLPDHAQCVPRRPIKWQRKGTRVREKREL